MVIVNMGVKIESPFNSVGRGLGNMGNGRGDQYRINGLRELTFDLFCFFDLSKDTVLFPPEEATLMGHRIDLYLDLDLPSFWNSEDTMEMISTQQRPSWLHTVV